RDSGCGMDEETRARAFEPFFSTKERFRGHGLGLSTVHGIVKQSGGEVWVRSEPSRGTIFTIWLPATTEPLAATDEDETGQQVPGGNETVLLAEDDEAVRLALERVLSAAGYQVLGAGNGQEALRQALASPGPIHALVSDVVMPGLPGPALAAQLQAARPDL